MSGGIATKAVTRNAKIVRTMLGLECGVFTVCITLEWSGAGQAFGHRCLDTPVHGDDGRFSHRDGTAYGMRFIMQLVKALDLTKWEELPGTMVRIVHDRNEIYRIGHITEDRWFDPEEVSKDAR